MQAATVVRMLPMPLLEPTRPTEVECVQVRSESETSKKNNMRNIILFLAVITALKTCGQEKISELEIHLSLNGKTSISLQRGFPWQIMVTVTNPAAHQAALAKSLLERETVTERTGKTRSLDSLINGIILGSSQIPWYQMVGIKLTKTGRTDALPLTVLNPLPDKTVRLDDENTALVFFGADPETTAGFGVGDYKLRAFFLHRGKTITNDTVWSEEVAVSLKDPPVVDFSTLDTEQISFVARYWVKRGDCKKAENLVNALSASSTGSIEILKAEILECLGDDEKALELYQNALDRFNGSPSYEPPEYLWDKIHDIQEKLGKKRN
jgi:hypothetical protein